MTGRRFVPPASQSSFQVLRCRDSVMHTGLAIPLVSPLRSNNISGRAGALTPPGRGNGKESSDA